MDLGATAEAPSVGIDDAVTAGLEAFCREHHGRLVGLLSLYTGDAAVAEQLAQDALVRLCDRWPRVRDMEYPDKWLTRVAFNGANSWSRRRAAEARAHARHGPVLEAWAEPDAADALSVRAAVAALPPRQRQALVLRYYGDLSVADTAVQMSCATGTVKSLTAKAVAALRTDLGIDLQEDDDGC